MHADGKLYFEYPVIMSHNYSENSLESLVAANGEDSWWEKKKETNAIYQRKYPTSVLEFLDFFLRIYERTRIHVSNYYGVIFLTNLSQM